jgi:hypothetical protein
MSDPCGALSLHAAYNLGDGMLGRDRSGVI